jgi:hypothetical protein
MRTGFVLSFEPMPLKVSPWLTCKRYDFPGSDWPSTSGDRANQAKPINSTTSRIRAFMLHALQNEIEMSCDSHYRGGAG